MALASTVLTCRSPPSIVPVKQSVRKTTELSSATPHGSRGGAQEPRRPGQNPCAGFSLVEVLIAIMLLTLVYAIAMPSLAATRVRASVHNSKHVVLSNISLARTAAIRFGRLAVLKLDPEGDRIWVEVDTTLAGSGAVRGDQRQGRRLYRGSRRERGAALTPVSRFPARRRPLPAGRP